MPVRTRASQLFPIAPALIAAAALMALLLPSAAGAATVANGDFEQGSLAGWQTYADGGGTELGGHGGWFAYSGTQAPLALSGEPEPRQVPPPPQGTFGAVTDENEPGTHILYQDIALEPYWTHRLSAVVYYHSEAPISVPSPDTLYFTGLEGVKEPESLNPNQQYRVDVINPSAPIESLKPADILATAFATKTGDPQELGATTVNLDLTPFAGQTVRLRFAEVDNQSFFNAGADSVSIVSTSPSNAIALGKPKYQRRKGTATLPVTVPGAGVVAGVDARFAKTASSARVSKAKKRFVKSVRVAARGAGTVKLKIKPTKAGLAVLRAKHRLRVRVAVSFTPTGGFPKTLKKPLVLKLAP